MFLNSNRSNWWRRSGWTSWTTRTSWGIWWARGNGTKRLGRRRWAYGTTGWTWFGWIARFTRVRSVLFITLCMIFFYSLALKNFYRIKLATRVKNFPTTLNGDNRVVSDWFCISTLGVDHNKNKYRHIGLNSIQQNHLNSTHRIYFTLTASHIPICHKLSAIYVQCSEFKYFKYKPILYNLFLLDLLMKLWSSLDS